jgi:hypothetical protein
MNFEFGGLGSWVIKQSKPVTVGRLPGRLTTPRLLLHDRPLSSVARDESRMAGGEPRMTGDYCRPEESIHRCVRTHSHLYSYIYMALWHS